MMKTKEALTRAAIYIRVSTREQALEGYSLSAQEHVLTEYCRIKKYEIVDIYRDEGISAKDMKHRPGLLQLLADSKDNKFDVILVWKLTRFSRNMANLMTMCEDLDRRGIALVSYSEAFDSTTPAGRMIRSMLGTVAQFEREVIAENVILAQYERAKQGKRTCSDVLGYDIDGKDSLKINPHEAEYVRFVFDKFLIYKNISEVAAVAKINGYHGKRGGVPRPENIRKILTRPVYCGYYSFRGEIFKGNHKPIISIEQYNRVQILLRRQGQLYGRKRKQEYATINY